MMELSFVLLMYLSAVDAIDLVVKPSDESRSLISCMTTASKVRITCIRPEQATSGLIYWYTCKSGWQPSCTDNDLDAAGCFTETFCSADRDNCFRNQSFNDIRYKFSSDHVKHEYYFDIDDAGDMDQQHYVCRLNVDCGYFNASLCVPVESVMLKHNNMPVQQNLEVVAGTPTTLVCVPSPDSSSPVPTIQWFIKDDLKQSSTKTDFTLNARKQDNGLKIFCKANNTESSSTVTSEKPILYVKVEVLSVELKLDDLALKTDSNLTVRAGKPVKLTCLPGNNDSTPTPTIEWFINSTKVYSSNTSYTYNLNATGEDHNKKIYCKAQNIPGRSVKSGKPVLFVQVQVSSIVLKLGMRPLETGEKLFGTHGERETITCTPGESRPTPTIIWFIGNQTQSATGSIFRYVYNKTDHNKDIYCTAYNLQSSVEAISSKIPKLYVRVKASAPALVTDITTFYDGETYAIRCQSTATRPAAVTVLQVGFNNLTITGDEENTYGEGLVSVTITASYVASKTDHNSHLICKSKIPSQDDFPETKKNIIIFWPPSTPEVVPSRNNFPWLEGQTGILKCNTSDLGNPLSTVVWSNKLGNETSLGELVISPLTYAHDQRSVQCQLENRFTSFKNEPMVSTATTLSVQYTPRPRIIIDKETVYNITVVEGYNITATCTADGNPEPETDWQETSSMPPDSLLTMVHTNRSQAGNYTCRATAKSMKYPSHTFREEAVLTVTVHYPPVVEVRQSTNDLRENVSVKLTCLPMGLPAQYTYHGWTQKWQDTEISSNPLLNTTSEYISIPSLQLQHSGNYTCQVDNTIRDRNKHLMQFGTTELRVRVSPKIFIPEPVYVGVPSENITITIPFYAFPNYDIVSLKQDGTEIDHKSDKFDQVIQESEVQTEFYRKPVTLIGYYLNFTVYRLTENDFTEYAVRITNALNTTEKSFKISAESKPLIPSNFRLQKQIGTTIVLYWEKDFNGGHPQRFWIQTKEAKQENWMNRTIVDEFDRTKNLGNKSYIANMTKLEPGIYRVRMIASNIIGQTDPVHLGSVITVTLPGEQPASSANVGLIAGGAAGGVVLAAITVVLILLFFRRRQDSLKSPSKSLLKDNERPANTSDTDDTQEINLNPMYESAGPLPSTSNNSEVYSEVDKNRKKVKPVGEIYSQVRKPKKQQSAGGSTVKNDIYAQIQKTTHTEKNAGTAKYKKRKPDKKTKKGKQAEGDLYDNVDTVSSTVTKADSVYENPSCSIDDEHPRQIKNQDGLIYADLDLPKEPVGNDRKAVIHGLDDKTDYVDIKFGEVGEQAPESDEENTNKDN